MNQNSGYNQATAVVNAFNSNYIRSRVTKTVFWYLICCTYPLEPWNDYGIMLAQEPWSGNYSVKPGLWGYAHYNQFVKVGWKFIDDACGNLSGGGTYVTLKSPHNTDFSIIIETKGSAGASNPSFTISGGLPTNKTLCVWRSTSSEQFVRQADITPAGGSFSLAVQSDAIYSISTTTGQQKGSFDTIPVSKVFPMPYYENYDHYTNANNFGYLPYYHADICGVFELADRPDGSGRCLRQVLQQKAQSWAPEWSPYTIIGDRNWTDYEVSADMYFDNSGWAGVMGRINNVGTGYGCSPNGYYLRLSSDGAWALYYASGSEAGTSLANGKVAFSGQWHRVKLQMSGSTITGFIDNNQVCSVTNTSATSGMAGLCTGNYSAGRNSAMFDNLLLNTVNGATPQPSVFSQDLTPPYTPTSSLIKKTTLRTQVRLPRVRYTTIGSQCIRVPEVFTGKNVAASVYDLKGALVKKAATRSDILHLNNYHRKANEVFIIEFKMLD